MSNKSFIVTTDNTSHTEVVCQAGKVSQNGEMCFHVMKCGNTVLRFDESGQAYAEIKDGLELEMAKGMASDFILSNEEVYASLRKKFVITIEVLPEEVLLYETTVRVRFEEKEKYIKRLKSKGGIVE